MKIVKKYNFLKVFLKTFSQKIYPFIVHLDLDPYSKSGSGCSNSVKTDPIQIRIRNPGCHSRFFNQNEE